VDHVVFLWEEKEEAMMKLVIGRIRDLKGVINRGKKKIE